MLFVPTLFAIILISFFLFQYSGTDDVANRLAIKGVGENDRLRIDYNLEYQKEAKKLHKDQPSFYFSIVPHYYPDHFNTLIFPYKIKVAKTLLPQVRDWGKVERFIESIDNYKSTYAAIPDSLAIFIPDRQLSKVEELLKVNDIHLIQAKLIAIADSNPLQAEVSYINESIKDLTESSQIYYPSFRWHGLDNQFQKWFVQILCGDFGLSMMDGRSVSVKIKQSLPWTFTMVMSGIILSTILSLFLGLVMVIHKDKWVDKLIGSILYIAYAVPVFWMATLLVVFFTTDEYGSWTNIFPSIGINPVIGQRSHFFIIWSNVNRLILPIICIVIVSMAYLSRQFRSSLIDELTKPYYTTARAKGLSLKKAMNRHIVPNALIPIVTILIGAIPSAFAGSVVLEVIFNIPGIGRVLFDAIFQNDWAIISTILIIISFVTLVTYLVGDILYSFLNPKISFGS